MLKNNLIDYLFSLEKTTVEEKNGMYEKRLQGYIAIKVFICSAIYKAETRSFTGDKK